MRILGLWRTRMALQALRNRAQMAKAELAVARFPQQHSKQAHGLDASLVVTLTSYPPRFAYLGKTLRSLLEQTVATDCTVLRIAHDDLPLLPPDVLELRSHGLEIRGCADLRSYKKLIPALRENPARYFVTADDDVYYPPHWLAGLVETARLHRAKVIAWPAHEALFDDAGRFVPYHNWHLATHRQEVQPAEGRLFPTGVGGIWCPLNAIAADYDNADLFMILAPQGDDIWLFWQARAKGTGHRRVPENFDVLKWPRTQDVGLYSDNMQSDGNDRQIAAMTAHYGQVP